MARVRTALGLFCALTFSIGSLAARTGTPDVAESIQTSRPDSSVVERKADRDAGAKKPRYSYRKDHDPNGIGKFYLGREIADVMGYEGSGWLERPAREREEKLSTLIEALKLKPGMVVADIGAGTGVVSVLLADKVGPKGKVLAVDMQKKMLALLAKKLKRYRITNVELVKGTPKSPRLQPGSVDLAIMVDVYHELDFPYEMMLEISKATKPGGQVVFVEYRREDPKVPIKLVHKMTEAQVKREIGQPEFGLKWVETKAVLPRQHIVVFERTAKSNQ